MLKIITEISELIASKENWNDLVGNSPFMRWEWMSSWITLLEPDTKPLVLVYVDSSGAWKGLAAFCRQTSRTLSRRVRFMGSGKSCSDYQNLFCREPDRAEFTAMVANFLSDMALGKTAYPPFNLLELDGVRADEPGIAMLIRELELLGFQSTRLSLEGSWSTELPNTIEEFRSLISKSMRRKVKEAGKRLDHPETNVLSSRSVPFEYLWETFVELHQQRRNMLQQSGCFAETEFERFLKNASRELCSAGLAELTVIENSDRPLAASLSLISNDTLMLYQTGFDVGRRRESPGYQIVLQAIRTAMERKLPKFDLLRGDEPYKARWHTQRIELAKLRLIPPTSVAFVRNNLWTAARTAKTFAVDHLCFG